ncbi:MAG TPA: DUF177 domain-containing protein [Deltaproteobacteria bacterium]|nr:DUF177 domain-containing protein [Deltaproteobacteria bacterium]HOM28793.1 DUF177 domain-containing protein [Deltaproteobacteria bacterium]HPP80060.1 DUF177 domain-containing protein [Deltaproteobacteria bacterium]
MDRPVSIHDIRLLAENIGEAGLERDITVSPADIQVVLSDVDVSVDEPFSVHYEVVRHQETFHVQVDIQGCIHATCARCLAPMDHRVDLHLESDYVPAPSDMTGDLEAQRVTAETGFYDRDIHLGKYICSELVLSLPYIYLCSETCKGMCPRCGANLNEGPCLCAKEVDPRLEVLGSLKTTR